MNEKILVIREDALIKRAFRRYFREAGPGALQPSAGSGITPDGRYVVLHNVKGELARFRVDNGKLFSVPVDSESDQ
jgi:hypothetical protein